MRPYMPDFYYLYFPVDDFPNNNIPGPIAVQMAMVNIIRTNYKPIIAPTRLLRAIEGYVQHQSEEPVLYLRWKFAFLPCGLCGDTDLPRCVILQDVHAIKMPFFGIMSR